MSPSIQKPRATSTSATDTAFFFWAKPRLMKWLFTLGLLVSLPVAVIAQDALQNDRYKIGVAANGGLRVEVAGMPPQILRPEFTVLSGATDPKLARIQTHPNYAASPRTAVRWSNREEPLEAINAWVNSPAFKSATGLSGQVKETKEGGREWEFRDAGGKITLRVSGVRAWETSRPFSVGKLSVVEAARGHLKGNTVQWEFASQPAFAFHAELTLPPGAADPEIRFTITPSQAGWFSVAFTGAPENELSKTLPIPQECDARGHKQFNFVMSEPDLHLPRVQVATAAGSVALVADPAECRFRLPDIKDSRFGAMLEEKDGSLRPVLLAPLFGGPESRMAAGIPWSFSFRYVQRPGDWKDAYVHIAREIHGFRDERDNSGAGSLNGTLERVMDFLADRRGGNRAMWDIQQKYYDYFTDKTGIYKPFSPLYGLSAAIVTDDEDFFRERALPAMEFAISRRSSVFAPYDNSDNKQANSALRTVGVPYPGYAQLLSLYEILQRRTPVLLDLAEKRGAEKNSASDALARWQLTGGESALSDARAAAMRLSGRAEEHLFDLLDLADASKEPPDLQRAVDAAYSNAATRLNLYPVPPDTMVTVDKGGTAPVHLHSFGRHGNIWGYPPPQPIQVPEQTVPAWRISRLGVPSPAYPMEYWMNTHGATLRVAGLARDTFLRDIAHWGVVGRFGNYPGDNRSKDSLVAERPDAVEAAPWKWNFATVNPGHAWDFAGAMLDFLVSDAFERSKGAMDFPALRAAGSSFRVRIYGGAPGVFYGDKGVYLWLPRGLVTTDNRQIDWLAGHGNGNLYLALWSQSFQKEEVTLTLDPSLVQPSEIASIRVWRDNEKADPLPVTDHRLTVTLSPKGIVALAIPAAVKTRLQAKLYDPATPPLGPQSFTKVESPFGPVHAMLLRAGRDMTSAFVYAEALPEHVISARLRWRQGDGGWNEIVDDVYPYEFSPHLADHGGDFSCVLEIEDARRQILRSPVVVLSPGDTPCVAGDPPPEKPFAPLRPTPAFEGAAEPPLNDEFVAYLKKAANPDDYGLRNGKFFPYSTPQGRRIAWRQPVWDKDLYAQGCESKDAERRLRADLARTQTEIIAALAARTPSVDYSQLDPRQRETLLDMAYTEGVTNLRPEIIAAILASDWERLIHDHLCVRYAGHAPDHVRNKAFAKRWNIQ